MQLFRFPPLPSLKSVADGIDLCPNTTQAEISLSNSSAGKINIDDKGCATLSATTWQPTFIGVTTAENGDKGNSDVQLLFTVDSDLPTILKARQYDLDTEMIQLRAMDASCQNYYDDDEFTSLLSFNSTINDTGSFETTIPDQYTPILIHLDLDPDKLVGSPIWMIEPPYDSATVSFCLSIAMLSDEKGKLLERFLFFYRLSTMVCVCMICVSLSHSISSLFSFRLFIEPESMAQLKSSINIDMTQDFSVVDIAVERTDATETSQLVGVEYSLDACQCDANDLCLDDFLVKDVDSLKLCVRFAEDDNGKLPPDYVQMRDVKTLTCQQGETIFAPILNFERQTNGGTVVKKIDNAPVNGSAYGKDDRMLTVDTRLPPYFFGPAEQPVDCFGTLVYQMTEGAAPTQSQILSPVSDRRVLVETKISASSAHQRRRNAEAAAEAESDFAVEVMLGKASKNIGPGIGVIVGAAFGCAIVALLCVGAAIRPILVSRRSKDDEADAKVPQRCSSITRSSWTSSESEMHGNNVFDIDNGICA